MGQVFIDFEVENSRDSDDVSAGEMPAPDVRQSRLRDVLMDTGATHLCLPADTIRALGLRLVREVPVSVATGVETRNLYRNALVRYEDREATVECIELPIGSPPLLGALPMEGLGIAPDLQNRRVRKLPLGPGGSYLST